MREHTGLHRATFRQMVPRDYTRCDMSCLWGPGIAAYRSNAAEITIRMASLVPS
jgi:hypothetical protein